MMSLRKSMTNLLAGCVVNVVASAPDAAAGFVEIGFETNTKASSVDPND